MTDEHRPGSGHRVSPEEDARVAGWRERALLCGVLGIALVLRVWDLGRNGWGAEYYSAAVRSMSLSLRNFLFAAFDPLGLISVDKPPLALWPQVISVKLFGYQPLALLLPQALVGVASVWVLYRLLRPRAGMAAAWLGALAFALTPVWVALNRTNNTDSLLLLWQLLAAWAALVAAERGSLRHLLLAALALGLAFNTKMLAAFVVLPAIALAWWFTAVTPWRRRLAHALLAAAALLAVSLSWALAVRGTSPEARPHVGGSPGNSVFELIRGHNAANRFALAADVRRPAEQTEALRAGPLFGDTRLHVRQLYDRLFVREPAGPARLARGLPAAQAGWLAPLALLGIAALFVGRHSGLYRARSLGLLWTAWALTAWALYSGLGGIMHHYYLATLAPAIAALAAIGATAAWRAIRDGGRLGGLLPIALVITAGWQAWIQASALHGSLDELLAHREPWLDALHLFAFLALMLSTIGLAVTVVAHTHRHAGAARRASGFAGAKAPGIAVTRGAAILGIAGVLALPLAWSLSSVRVPGFGILPSADLYRMLMLSHDPRALGFLRFGRPPDVAALAALLRAEGSDAPVVLLTTTAQLAAPLIIETGLEILPRGGYHGTDRIWTVDELARRVARGELRFALVGDMPAVSRRLGALRADEELARWIREHGEPVTVPGWTPPRLLGQVTLYRLGPQGAAR